MYSIENFPDAHALDADITRIPLGPQDPSIHTSLSARFESDDRVTTVIVQQEHTRERGGLQLLVNLADTDNIRSTARELAREHITSPLVYTVSDTPDRVGCAWPENTPIHATITVYRHPLVPFIDSVVNDEPTIQSVSYDWPFTNRELPASPATVSWNNIPPVTVTINGAEPALDTITTRITDRIVSTIPHAYSVDIDRTDTTGSRELSLAFTERTTTHDRTGIYRTTGASIDTVISPEEDGIQLTVTSPPYLDAIDYENYTATNGSDDWSKSADDSLDDKLRVWKSLQHDVFSSVYDATRDGGYCVVVIGHVKTNDDTWVALPHEFMNKMSDIGWEFHERIIWNKVTNGSPRFGTTIQNPHPTYYYPNQMHEEILVLRKGDPVRRRESNEELVMSDVMKSDVANNVWHIPPVPHNKNIDHPAPFPEELVHRLVVLYSHPGDIVADPMIGSGTTAVVADRLDRVAIGTEQEPVFTATARNRLFTETYERSNQLIPSYERVDGSSDRAALTHTTTQDELGTNGHDTEQSTLSLF